MTDPRQAAILLVEDNPTHRFMYSFQFQQAGFSRFTTASSAEDGLESIRREKPDLILLDLVLRSDDDLDGLEVLRRLKESPTTRAIPVIVLSNKRRTDMAQRTRRLGAEAYLLKAEYLPRQVVEEVRQFLARRAES